MKILWIATAIFVYFVLFYSIFDIYYTSPLVRNVQPINPNTTSLATHLIFIVADGMRADFLFGKQLTNMPFIRDLILNQGIWGLSHTRVPTESRPGHIAMLGGFYEDVAAITKGWKSNPVEFDSILNRSNQAWASGSQEVITGYMSHDTKPVQLHPAPPELHDLTRDNIFEIDDWVVDQFVTHANDLSPNGLFAFAPDSPSSPKKGMFAFLHLEAADMVGHAFNPGSPQYIDLLLNLDRLVGKIVGVAETRAAETGARVAYLLTADHGMTDWGSHGAGSLAETITPFMLWGAGISHPKLDPANSLDFSTIPLDEQGIPLSLVGRNRRQLRQADLCPLMAALLGIPIPVNSVGMTPLDFLSIPSREKLQLARTNFIQIYTQFLAKEEEKRASHFSLLFREFNICIGLTFCLSSVTILCLLIGPVGDYRPSSQQQSTCINCIRVLLISLIAFVVLFAYSWPLMHSVYQLTPLLLTLYLITSPSRLGQLQQLTSTAPRLLPGSGYHNSLFGLLLVSVIIIETIVWGFNQRWLLSVACCLVALWPVFDSTFGQGRRTLRLAWSLAFLVLSIFPLLPVIGKNRSPFIVYSSGLGLLLALPPVYRLLNYPAKLSSFDRSTSPSSTTFKPIRCIVLFLLTLLMVWLTDTFQGSMPFLQGCIHKLSWCLLVALPIGVVKCSPPNLGPRLFAWAVALTGLLILLSTHYEIVFFVSFMTVCFIWLQLEASNMGTTELWSSTICSKPSAVDQDQLPFLSHDKKASSALSVATFRQSLFFIFLLQLSFFGTGNIASVNSFDPRTTYCFVTVLDVSIMAVVIAIKILLPMLFLGAIHSTVQYVGQYKSSGQSNNDSSLILARTGAMAVLIANCIALHFFFLLRDEGSWLEIGQSISNYVIAMATGLVASLFTLVGRYMMTLTLSSWPIGWSVLNQLGIGRFKASRKLA